MEKGTNFFYNGVEFRTVSVSDDKVKGTNDDVRIKEPAEVEVPTKDVLFLN